MFQRVGMSEGEIPLPLAFQYLILMVWRHFDLNFIIISLLASKCQDFKVEMPVFQPFYEMKLKTSNFKVLAFCSQWKYNDQIQVTRSSYHKNQILKCLWEWLSSLPHSRPPEHSHFTVETGKTAYTFEKQCTYSNWKSLLLVIDVNPIKISYW